MAYRLVCQIGQRTVRVLLRPGRNSVGSGDDCNVGVRHPTVSRRHAVIEVTGDKLTVEDLGSSNGTLINDRRFSGTSPIAPGIELSFGSVRAHVEEVREGDLEPAVSLPSPVLPRPMASPPSEAPPIVTPKTTLSASALEDFTFGQLPRLLERLERGAGRIEMAQAIGAAIFHSFPCPRVEVRRQGPDSAVVFSAGQEDPSPVNAESVEQEVSDLVLRATFYPPSLAAVYAPILDAGRRLIGLSSSRSSESSPLSRGPSTAPPLPAPPSIEPKIRDLYFQAARVARGDVSVLIQGESGTGKEVLARYIHEASGRDDDRFLALNCAALPRDLLELELFGIESGVATGVDARPGKFELADGGTLFLDEIGDMELGSQAKILRVLQEREVYRLGGKQPRSARVRVLAATNQDVQARVADGNFRSDLYHRIAGWVARLPSLRHRRADIPNLAAHFLAQEAERLGTHLAGISQSTMTALVNYAWPGNIRELQREIARAALFLAEGDLLESTHLEPALRQGLERSRETLKDVLEQVERDHIERALALTHSVPEAARQLGIGRSTLYRRMRALGLQEPISS